MVIAQTARYVFVGDAASLVKAGREAQATMDATAKSSEASATKIGSSQKKATEQTEGFHLRMRRSFAGVAASATKGALEIGAAYASIEGVKKAVDSTTELAETTVKLSKNFGLAADQASRYAGVAESRGIAGTSLTMGFKTLSTAVRNATEGIGGQSKALTDLQAKDALKFKQDQALGASAVSLLKTRQGQIAAEGALAGKTSAQIKIFQELGISQQDLVKHGGDLNWVINRVSDGLEKLGPGTNKAAIAAKLFGKNAQAMGLLVGEGSKALNEQLQLADKYGVTLHGKSVKSIEEMIQAQRENKLAMLGLQISLGTLLIPTLTKAVGTFDKFVAQVRDGTGEGGKFAHALTGIWNEAKPTVEWVGKASESIAGFVGHHKGLQQLLTDVLLVGAAIKGIKFVGAITGMTSLLSTGATVTKKLVTMFGERGAAAGTAFDAGVAGTAGGAGALTGLKAVGLSMGGALAAGILGALADVQVGDWLDKIIPDKKYTLGLFGGAGKKAKTSPLTDSKTLSGLAALTDSGSNYTTTSKNPGSYRAQAAAAAKKYGVPESVFLAQINQESGFNPNAVSSAGAIGIAQIIPSTAKAWGVDPRNPSAALDAAAKNMAIYIKKYGSVEAALRAYNSGSPTGHSSETNNYVSTILGASGGSSSSGVPDLGSLTSAAQGELAQTAAQKAAAAAKKAAAARHAALVKAHNEQIKAASRAVNKIASKFNPSGDIRLANIKGTAIDNADAQYGRDQRTGDLNVELAGGDTTAAGYAARKSELASLAKEKQKQLEREKQELAHYQAADKKYTQIIKAATALLSKTHGPARAKIRDRIKSYDDKRTDIRASIDALGGTIQDTKADLEDLTVQGQQADQDYQQAQPTASDVVSSALDTIDAHVRAGDLTQAQGDQQKIDTINGVLANPNNGLTPDQILDLRGTLADAIKDQTDALAQNTSTLADNTSALKDATDALNAQMAFANQVSAVTSMQAVRALGDVITGNLGARVGTRAMMPGSGQISRL